MRAPQQHEEYKDGCEARLTCACGVFIEVLYSKLLFVGKMCGIYWTFFFRDCVPERVSRSLLGTAEPEG